VESTQFTTGDFVAGSGREIKVSLVGTEALVYDNIRWRAMENSKYRGVSPCYSEWRKRNQSWPDSFGGTAHVRPHSLIWAGKHTPNEVLQSRIQHPVSSPPEVYRCQGRNLSNKSHPPQIPRGCVGLSCHVVRTAPINPGKRSEESSHTCIAQYRSLQHGKTSGCITCSLDESSSSDGGPSAPTRR